MSLAISKSEATRAAALEAWDAGLCVVPPAGPGDRQPKRPSGKWKTAQRERPSREAVDRLYSGERAWLGLVCGAISGGLELFEFDCPETYERFRATAARLGLNGLVDRIEMGYSEDTPGGGVHWFYRCGELRGNTKLAQRPGVNAETGKPEFKVLIETRGEGGYSVVAPTVGLHANGRGYTLRSGGFRSIETLASEDRDTLWALARSFDESPVEAPREQVKEAGGRPKGEADGIPPGTDFNERGSWGDVLDGWSEVGHAGNKTLWRRPGKSAGWSATTGFGDADLLYVFSTSTEFRAEKWYTRFAAYAASKCRGDFSEAARELAARGFGTYTVPIHDDAGQVVRYEHRQNPRPKGVGRSGKPSRNGKPSLNGKPPEGPIVPTDSGDGNDDDARLAGLPRTDLGNAERLVARHGRDLRYCHPWSRWLVWDGKRWKPDDTAAVRRKAKDTVRRIIGEAASIEDDDRRKALVIWGLKSEERKRIDSMLFLASAEAGIPILTDQMDCDPWLLNCLNGTVDLRSGKLHPHQREDLITKLCPVKFDPDARCPRWEQFEREIFAGDEEVIGYMRRAMGYSLSAIDSVQEINILFGEGSNGKNVYLDTLRFIVGDYGCQAEPNLLLSNKAESHPTGLADLHGRRLVSLSETDDGKRLAEALVKRLTGDATIKARRMRQDFFEFQRTFKVFLATNHKPEVQGDDHAIWRRIRLVPFNVKFVKKGQPVIPPLVLPEKLGLTKDLMLEAPGILALMVRGCLDWQRGGMRAPEAVSAATDEYRKEMDHVGEFIDECCDDAREIEGAKTKANVLYHAYEEWFKSAGLRPGDLLTSRKFGSRLERRGFKLDKSNSACWRTGIRLKEADAIRIDPAKHP